MSNRVYRFGKPDHWRDRAYLQRTLLSLVAQYDGLALDAFAYENLGYFGWRPFEVRRVVYELVHGRVLIATRDSNGQVVVYRRKASEVPA